MWQDSSGDNKVNFAQVYIQQFKIISNVIDAGFCVIFEWVGF